MKSLVSAFLLLLLACLAGCGSNLTPTQKAIVASDTLAATTDAIGGLYEAKVIPAKTFLEVQPAIKAAESYVNSMFAAAEAGSEDKPGSDFYNAARAFESGFAELLRIRAEGERAKKRPATQPATPSFPSPG